MSTKTTFKRVALVAVASLGFGMLSVAPSSAAAASITTTVTVTSATLAGTVTASAASQTAATPADAGKAVSGNLRITPNATVAAATTVPITWKLTAPDGSDATASVTFAQGTLGTNVTSSTFVGSTSTVVLAIGFVALASVGTFSFIPTMGGTYKWSYSTGAATGDYTTAQALAAVDNTPSIFVSGSLVTQGTSIGLNGTAVPGNQAQVLVMFPAAAATYKAVVTGVGSISGAIANTSTTFGSADGANATTFLGVSGVATDLSQGVNITTANTTVHAALLTLVSPIAGTQTLTISTVDAATGISKTLYSNLIVWGAAATVAPSLSTAFIGLGNTRATAEAVASTLRFSSTSTTSPVANIAVTLVDANGLAMNGLAVSATVSGPGLISATAGVGAVGVGNARVAALTSTVNSTNQFSIGISADGTKGVSTVTVYQGTTVIATKTLTFYGAVATLTATQGVGIMRSGRTAASTVSDYVLGGTDAALAAASAITRATATNISIVAKDVDGNVVPGVAVTADISNLAVISDVTITSCAGGAALTVCASGAGNFIASTTSAIGGVSGATATVTFKTPHPTVAGTFISTAALPFSLGGTALGGTVTMTTDKTTYAPGERINISYTAKDAAGNPVRDWTAVAAPSANKAVIGLAGDIFVGGKAGLGDDAGEYVYAPATTGEFTLTLATGTATGAEITAKVTVSDDAATAAASAAADAAAEATDAANAATDAANAAAEAADAATAAAQDAADAVAALSTSVTAMVSELKKQITALTNLVIKIQKKVRA